MQRWARKFLLLVILATVGAVTYKVGEAVWQTWLSRVNRNPAEILDYLPEAAVQIKDFHRTNIEGDRTVWEILGKEARYFKEKAQASIESPRFTFYSRDGKSLQASAQEGRLFFIDREVAKIEMEGDIEVRFQGFVLHTERMVFLKRDDRVIVPGRVRVRGDGLDLEGVGMEIDLVSEKLRLLSQVRTKLRPDRLEKLESNSDNGNSGIS